MNGQETAAGQADKHAGGRPIEITEERLKRLAACRIMDMNKVQTASFLGVSRQTYENWLNRAEYVQKIVDTGQEGLLTQNDKIYLKFFYIYNNATVELMAGCIAEMRAHGKKDWRALAWILTHMDPAKWANFEAQPVIGKQTEEDKAAVAEEHKEFDPYEPERIARLILSYQEADIIPEEISAGIIARSLSEDEEDKIFSGNGNS